MTALSRRSSDRPTTSQSPRRPDCDCIGRVDVAESSFTNWGGLRPREALGSMPAHQLAW